MLTDLRSILALAEEKGVKNIHLSLSHSREYALAMVILEG